MNRHRDPLTYRHPRNLTEAFGCDASSANPISAHKRSKAERTADVLTAVILGLAFGALFAYSI